MSLILIKTQRFNGTALAGFVGTLDATLCWRCSSADDVDIEIIQRTSKWRHVRLNDLMFIKSFDDAYKL
ncbi:MAG: hypothetical protein ACNYPE_02225 [Candidatus Azotimanducaceae bacterium WSBS_2022_MAG_OTU7]